MEFTAFEGELEVQKRPRKATTRWQVWVATEVFFVTTELSSFVSRQWVLCCKRIWYG